MELSILTPIVAALATLSGVALTAFIQSRIQVRNQLFLASSEVEKHQREQGTRNGIEAQNRLVVMHKLVSKLQREFSITALDILWRANTPEGVYDTRYLAICDEADELSALAHLYEPAIREDVERMQGQMNIFWGNLMMLLHRTAMGKEVDHDNPALSKAHAAAREIASIGQDVKRHLAKRMREEEGGC